MLKEDAFKRILADERIPSVVERRISDTLGNLPEPEDIIQTDKKMNASDIRRRRIFHPGRTAAAACLASGMIFSGICITHPVMAADIPLVGNVFSNIGQSLGFGGDFSSWAEPAVAASSMSAAADSSATTSAGAVSSAAGIDAASAETAADGGAVAEAADTDASSVDHPLIQTTDGTSITIQDTYCGGNTLYISLIIQSQTDLPVTQTMLCGGKPLLNLNTSLARFSFDDPENGGTTIGSIDGEFLNSKTYEGVIRLVNRENDFPEHFRVSLDIRDILGSKKDGTYPEIPEDLQQAYQKKLTAAGLSDEKYESYSDEQKKQMDQWWSDMMEEYSRRYPDRNNPDSPYIYWKIAGPWKFDLDVTRNDSDIIHKNISVKDLPSVESLTLTKTPFELSIQARNTPDSVVTGSDGSMTYQGERYFYVLTDATGDWMAAPLFADTESFAVKDWDTSSVTIYAMPYMQYMDEIKGEHVRADGSYIHKDWRSYLESYALWKETVDF